MDMINFQESELKEIYGKIKGSSPKDIRMQIINKKKNEEGELVWSINSTSITESLAKKIKDVTLTYIEKCAGDPIKDFDITNDQSDKYLIEKLKLDAIPTTKKILSEMQRDDNPQIKTRKLAHSTYLVGFAVNFPSNILIFYKVTKRKLIQPQKYLLIISSNSGEFTDIKEENLLAVPDYADAILYENDFFIFKRNHFINLFNFQEIYDKHIRDAQDNLNKVISDVPFLLDAAKNDIRKYKKLSSICTGFLDNITNNKGKLQKVAKDYNLQIKFSNDLIDIRNSNINDVLKLLALQPVKDVISNTPWFAQEKTRI